VTALLPKEKGKKIALNARNSSHITSARLDIWWGGRRQACLYTQRRPVKEERPISVFFKSKQTCSVLRAATKRGTSKKKNATSPRRFTEKKKLDHYLDIMRPIREAIEGGGLHLTFHASYAGGRDLRSARGRPEQNKRSEAGSAT